MKRFAWPLGIFLVLVAFLGVGLRLKPQEIPSPLIEKAAPLFTLPRVEDESRRFESKEMLGKVWLLNVWASWCGPCRKEHPVLVDFARLGVAPVVGLNYTDKRDESGKWLVEHGNPYLVSAFDGDGKVGMEYGVYGVPETFVIDKQGRIRHKHVGPITQEVVREKLLPLVQELNRG
ncbi:DsbE family thiol:disulfide interchange protein [Pseudoduganella namucuonensis]|uniref:Cytochrome c biogenesis protein CcmG, thiol:disulfide interchange protein DsbE n=1 Tax=Pseudoduganella namucuonensis TaxID=1035707 RepID=A0A1I7M658_9BURK|nr:DsbE family thiol:disulfide interchange protein [Pseudoduganella namucuonensis]SFV17439.1 cytochrome c biogenesis protein CcmG, thiol:disulfide interchange protein DsbE [Pseudoduganella namucuonensis]